MCRPDLGENPICGAGGGTVYTLVLEASASRLAGSSPASRTTARHRCWRWQPVRFLLSVRFAAGPEIEFQQTFDAGLAEVEHLFKSLGIAVIRVGHVHRPRN